MQKKLQQMFKQPSAIWSGQPSAVALIQYYFISEIISGAAKENMADFIKPDEIKSIKKMIKGLIKANCKRHKYYPN
jgi:hypothetical protein